ncbi:hypothetical protein Pyn_01169 [Prunus yedoensis var. nudiflora]|uniref:Uncharacterized protein n=1 Tax=Prunus yedoensis var. nudiflora TaxID=2094558 RepID=A0A314ZMJ0_PRUYE|nr:hypothetical protein Pyn_01169 [Prunus yedoensis var. nudiflora]
MPKYLPEVLPGLKKPNSKTSQGETMVMFPSTNISGVKDKSSSKLAIGEGGEEENRATFTLAFYV